MLHGYGITSIQVAAASEPDLAAYTSLDATGDLDLRIVASIWWERDETEEQIPHIKELREQYTKGNVRATTVKIMQDGVMENYTAVMLEPYLIPEKSKGIPMVEPEFLKDVVTMLDAEDFQVHFHAIGDGAIRQALDAIEAARTANGASDHRHHISHLQLIDPADIPRFAALDTVANFQPLWAYPDDYIIDLTIPFIGEERAKWLYPIKSVIDSGGRVAFGSDWSVSTADPFAQMETAVTRMDIVQTKATCYCRNSASHRAGHRGIHDQCGVREPPRGLDRLRRGRQARRPRRRRPVISWRSNRRRFRTRRPS